MRRQKRFKKIRLPLLLEDLKEKILKKIIIGLVIVLFFIISLVLAKAFLYRSDYFRLRAVETKDVSTRQNISSPANGELLKSYKDRNIFDINIKGIAQSLETLYPDAKDIIVRRVLPDKIVIDLSFRKPVALVGDTKYRPVDEEGFVLTNADARSMKGLPVITGVDIKNEAKQGKRGHEYRNLKTALDLLKEISKSRFPTDNIDTIDAGDVNNMTLHLKDGLEVRIGCENFKERLNRFKKMMRDPRLVVDRIKYVDLRFKDAVIGPK